MINYYLTITITIDWFLFRYDSVWAVIIKAGVRRWPGSTTKARKVSHLFVLLVSDSGLTTNGFLRGCCCLRPREKKTEADWTPLDLASFEIEWETKDGRVTKVRYPLFLPSALHRFVYVAHLYFFLHAFAKGEEDRDGSNTSRSHLFWNRVRDERRRDDEGKISSVPSFCPSSIRLCGSLYFFLHATTDDEAHMGDKGFPINSALSIRFEFEVRAALVRKNVSLSAIIECKLMHTHRFIFIA
jgi:hypothetical protein